MSSVAWRSHSFSRRQQGWSLIEAVVAVLLMGFMAAGLWKMMGLVQRDGGGEHSREVVQRAEDALLGMLLRDHALPRPDDEAPSPGRPNHLEGWLPVGVLGTEPPRRIRYLVDASLVAPPVTYYQPDPMNLLPSGTLGPRAINGLDVCFRLVQREQGNVTVSGEGQRLAFGLQTRGLSASASAAANTFVLGNAVAAAPGAGEQVRTRTAGYAELLHRLNCIPVFARLATEVKTIALVSDLHDQAVLNAKLHDLLVRATRESLVNAIWRLVNSAARLMVSTWNTAQAMVTMQTTPFGMAMAGGTLAAFTVEATFWAMILKFSADAIQANQAALPKAIEARDAAHAYVQYMAELQAWHRSRANDFQGRGVMP